MVAVIGVLAAAAAGCFAVTWLATPSTNSVLLKVQRVDQIHRAASLAPGAVPKQLAKALVSIEDAQFYQDNGVDVQGLLRAAGYDVIHRCECQGGSTITEELAQDIYLGGSDRSILGRWVDIVLALKISQQLSKSQILAAFLSEVYLGHGAYGAPQASLTYFGQPLQRDDLAQFALLAGLPQDPSGLDPLVHPTAARYRRAEVLTQMAANGYITQAQAAKAERAPV